MIRSSAAILLAIGLSATVLIADDSNKRYYDKSHKDYHQWNANEDRNFGIFLGERHIKVHVWAKAPASEQQQYWIWRHEHPDHE